MIVPQLPVLEDKKAQEEIRKAILDLARQLNDEINAINARLDALEAAP